MVTGCDEMVADAGGVAPSDAQPIDLGSSLTVTDVAEMYRRLAVRLAGPDALELDGSQMEMVDGAGLQLLLALFKQAAQDGYCITWLGASPALRRAARTVGLAEALQLGD